MARYYLGIDVSKGYSVVSILDSKTMKFQEPLIINDTYKGREQLQKLIDRLTNTGSLSIGLETTGGYERPLSFFLFEHQGKYGYEVFVVNPYKFAQWRKYKGTKSSDDQVSSKDLAMYLYQEYERERSNWRANTNRLKQNWEMRRLVYFIISQLKAISKLKAQLKSSLYQIFPGLLSKWKEKLPGWVYRVLQYYPSAFSIEQARDKEILEIEGVGVQRLSLLRTLSKKGGRELNSEFESIIVQSLAKQILALEEQLDELKKKLADQLEQTSREEFEIVKSINGISDWTGAAFLVLLGSWDLYNDKTKLAGFFGVYPTKKVSGDGKSKSRMSKRGNSKMRAILYLMAENAVIHEPYFRSLYHKYKSKGKHHYQVIGILMNKLLRILWGMLKNGEKFNPQKDMNYRKRTGQQSKTQIELNELHNLMNDNQLEEHLSAPISGRRLNKIKKILSEQQKDIKNRATPHAKLESPTQAQRLEK